MRQELLEPSSDAGTQSFESARSWARFEALLRARDVPGCARREAAAQERFDYSAALAEAEPSGTVSDEFSHREEDSLSDESVDEDYSE
jgi:hypothetical protein